MAITYSACIPTYRRPHEVERFLSMFEGIARKTGLKDKFELCISDNNEDLETKKAVDKYMGKLNIRYHRWGKNVGYDRNSLMSMKLSTGRFFHVASDEIEFTPESFSAMMALLEKTDADGVCIRPRGRARAPAELYSYSLSPSGVAGYYTTYMSILIMGRRYLDGFLKFNGKEVEKYFGHAFIHLPVFLYFMQHAKTMGILAFEMDFGKQGALLPSRLSDLYLHHYFFLMKACCQNGMVSGKDFARFKRSFLICLPFLFFKVRIYMNPKIYGAEIGKVNEKLALLPQEYGALGRIWIALWRAVLFNSIIPYHLAYRFWHGYKVNVQKDQRTLDLFEEYDKRK